MQRIKSISLTNFKFFLGDVATHPQNVINIDRNNLLLYGENGSGKSSIYWALYTFLQSALKQNDDDIRKYFLHDKGENLRNRFAQNNAPSGIEVHFEDDHQVPEIRHITNVNINTKQGNFVKKTLDSSDFLNYKYLSKVYDFRNSESIDLFPLFEKELLMFVDLGEEYLLHDGSLSGTTNAADWWSFITSGPSALPYNGNIVSVSSQEYVRFKNVTIPKFVSLLKAFLLDITQTTNEYLRNEFNEGYSVSFNVESITCDYNKNISTRAKDGKIHLPKIPLIVTFNHVGLLEANRSVNKPHTFLNEAKLTAIALAIRLAILDKRPIFGDSSRLLILDDLLLSLDMSHRNTVLDIILKKQADFQLIILTHDKLFFEMARHKTKKFNSDKWKYIEMYSTEVNNIPQPLVFESDTYLGNAEKFLRDKRYEIAGNYLRKEAEQFCKNFLPDKYRLGELGQIKPLAMTLQESINYAKKVGIDTLLIEALDSYRKFLLNDASHDSFDVPKFKSEIENCILVLKELEKLKSMTVLKRGDELEFELQTAAGTPADKAGTYKFQLIIEDDFRLIKEEGKASVLSHGMINYYVTYNGNKGALQHSNTSLKSFYDSNYMHSDHSKNADFWEEISIVNDGRKLKEIRFF